MDTKSLIAIGCVVIAIIILLSLTIYTVVTAWRKICREHAERQHSTTAGAPSYEDIECVKKEQLASGNNFTEDMAEGETNSEYERATSERCQTADSNDRVATASKHGEQSTGGSMLDNMETKDTSFWKHMVSTHAPSGRKHVEQESDMLNKLFGNQNF